MSRTTPLALLLLPLLLATAECARRGDDASTTTVTSASTSSARAASASEADNTSTRLAREICARELACGAIGDDARYPSEEACMADQDARAPGQMARWNCTPTNTQGTFEECLAAVRSEHCETALLRVDQLAACRSTAVCGR